MSTADGDPSGEGPREPGPGPGDERAVLTESLRRQRRAFAVKCEGLDASAMARRALQPSTMSLLGLVRHLAEIERGTFRVFMAGQDAPWLFCSPADPDGDFAGAAADPRLVEEAWAAWRAEVEFATRFLAEAPGLDLLAEDEHSDGAVSLREAVVGMIEEYGRHLGHADLLREHLDARLGR